MKINELIQRIQSLYSKGVQSDDTRLSNRHVYNKIKTVRSKLVSQEAKKKQKISSWNYQPIPCIELIKVDAHDCPCIPPVGCKILRSKDDDSTYMVFIKNRNGIVNNQLFYELGNGKIVYGSLEAVAVEA